MESLRRLLRRSRSRTGSDAPGTVRPVRRAYRRPRSLRAALRLPGADGVSPASAADLRLLRERAALSRERAERAERDAERAERLAAGSPADPDRRRIAARSRELAGEARGRAHGCAAAEEAGRERAETAPATGGEAGTADPTASAAEYWATLSADDRRAALDGARRMLVAPADPEPPTAEAVLAEAQRSQWAGSPGGRAHSAAERARAAAERAAYAERPIRCAGCGGETDHRARAELGDGSALCLRCAIADGGDRTAAGRMLVAKATAAGILPA